MSEYQTNRISAKVAVRLCCLLVGLSVVSACGFKLRGSIALSDDISPIYVQENSVQALGKEIKNLISSNKLQSVESASQANSIINLLSDKKSRRILSVDSSGRAREYKLQYHVSYSLKVTSTNNENNTGPLSPVAQTLSVSRNLLFDPDAVLAVSNEAEVLYRDMQRDVARKILLKLEAHAKARAEPKAQDKSQAEPKAHNNSASAADTNPETSGAR